MKKMAENSIQLGGINLSLQTADQGAIIDNEDKFGILIEGHTLSFIQSSKSMKKKFLAILAKCEAVVVCRASPSQKGQVVDMIKESEPDAVTLAIGDGANDVNMIQKAHVGIGIFGKEGY
jgi:magnesium-transporting ATPase (P-type)